MPPRSVSSPADIRNGIVLMLAGMSLFCFNDALGKWLVSAYPVPLLLAVRSLAAGTVLAPMVRRQGIRRTFTVTRWRLHLLRMVLITGDIGLFYWASRDLPLAVMMTIYMASPLIVTVLSAPLLGEKVDWRCLVAAVVGFVGVILVLNPAGDFKLWPSVIAVSGMLVYSLGLLSTRNLRADGNLTLLSIQTVGTGAIGALLLTNTGTPMPTLWDVGLLCLTGLAGLGGHSLMNRSLGLAPAGLVVPFQYVSILWAMALDFIVWHTAPDLRGMSGAVLIIGGGLFIFFREPKAESNPVPDAD